MKSSLNHKIASRIRSARKRAKMSLQGLGDRVGVSRQYLCNIESANKLPSEKTLSALCRELGLDFDELWCSLGNVPQDVIDFLASNPEALTKVRKAMKATRASSRAA